MIEKRLHHLYQVAALTLVGCHYRESNYKQLHIQPSLQRNIFAPKNGHYSLVLCQFPICGFGVRFDRRRHTKGAETSAAFSFPNSCSTSVTENSIVVPGPLLVTILPSTSTLDSTAVAQVAPSFSINTG